MADLNAQAEHWCRGLAAERRCPEDRDRTVAEVFAQEQGSLLALPGEHIAELIAFDGSRFQVLSLPRQPTFDPAPP